MGPPVQTGLNPALSDTNPANKAFSIMTAPTSESAPAAVGETAGPTTGSLLVIFLTVFIDLLGFAMVLPLVPLYAKAFSVGEHGWQIGLLMSCFSIMQFIFAPLWGRLSDRIGRRPVLIVGLAGSTFFYAMFGVSAAMRSLTGLFLTRIGAGIAGATISTAQAYIADCTTTKTRTKGMALIGAAFGLGFTLGPLVGAAALWMGSSGDAAIAASPWPGYAAAILSGIALVFAIFVLPESLRPDIERAAASRGLFDWQGLVNALSTPTVGVILLTSFMSVVAFGGFETTLGLLLKDEKLPYKYGLDGILLFYSYIGVVLTITQGFLVRRLAGRISDLAMVGIGAVLTVVGFLLMLAVLQEETLWMLRLACGVEVMGFAFLTPSLASLISRRSDPEKQGSILGISQGVSALARIVGPVVAVPLFVNRSHASPFIVSIVLMLIAVVFLIAFGRGGKDFGNANANSGMMH